MSDKLFPTKANLLKVKKTYKLSKDGYELLDKKRNILLRELTALIDESKDIQKEVNDAYEKAYEALKRANMTVGINKVQDIANAIHDKHTIDMTLKSVMGIDIPKIKISEIPVETAYGFSMTNSTLDEAYSNFCRAAYLTVRLAETENSVLVLAQNISKTQKRANALKNIMIPKYLGQIKEIQSYLEEKEREEFFKSKVIKNRKNA